MRLCAIVPVYNHERAVAGTLAGLRVQGLPVILVDDGSYETCAAELCRLAKADPDVRVVRLRENQGKGGAVIPRHRLYLRYLTHGMVWLNTLSFDIPDSMCGLRVYPLELVLPVIDAERPGRRMDFDIEILVRLHWRNAPMRWIPARVRYPQDGVSHFRLVRDNWLITCMHTRLFLGMLRRSPALLARRVRSAWATSAGVHG